MTIRSVVFAGTILAAATPLAASAQEIEVWARIGDDSVPVYDQMAAAFTAKTGIKVKYFFALTDFEQRLNRAAAGRDLPDVVLNDAAAQGQMREMGIIEEIDPATIAGTDQMIPKSWDIAKSSDGKAYGVPTSTQSFALFIRKDWREKVGMEQPKTWDDVTKLAEAFTKNDPDGNGQNDTFGFILPAGTMRGYTTWFLSSYIWQGGGDFLTAKGAKFTSAVGSPQNAATLGYFRNLICSGYTQPGAINASTADAIPSFRSGQTGMFLTGPYHLPLFDKEPGPDKYEVVKPPLGPGGTVKSLADGKNAYLMKGSDEPDAAKAFIEFLISEEGQTIGLDASGGSIPAVRLPVNKNVDMIGLRKDPRWQVFVDTYAEGATAVPAIPNWVAVRTITSDSFNAILSDCNADIPAALAVADEAVNAELKKQDFLAE